MTNIITCKVKSDKGFYIGDICYVLSDKVYSETWCKENNYKEGLIDVSDSDCQFAVARTAHGDGDYFDNEGRYYSVDAGVIGLVPLELVSRKDGSSWDIPKDFELGTVVHTAGVATFSASSDGSFKITLPNNEDIIINTNDDGVYRYPMDFFI